MEETKQQFNRNYINSLREKFLKEEKEEKDAKARKMVIWKEMTSLLLQAEKVENAVYCLADFKETRSIQDITCVQWDNKKGGYSTIVVEKKEIIQWETPNGEIVKDVVHRTGNETLDVATCDIIWGFE